MSNLDLYPHQIEAIKRGHNGCIFCGGTGSGKSRTGLAYYYLKVCEGSLKINGQGDWAPPKKPRDLYIITVAKKRDSLEWEHELLPFLISTDNKNNPGGIKVTIDSWNNIKKYQNVFGAFFLMDEQKVSGKGKWAKTFIRISRRNQFVLLSATPGDKWEDYATIFIANGFYKNRTDFNMQHVILSPYAKYPKIDHYINEGLLIRHRRDLLITMDFKREAVQLHHDLMVGYDKELYLTVFRKRWDPYDNCPIEEVGKLCYLLRRVVNSNKERLNEVVRILNEKNRAIIFYNYDYEVELLKETLKEECPTVKVAEWNGHTHQQIPDSYKWAYICQYNSAAEGWNCITTDTTIFYSQSYSYRQTVQAAGRIDRLNTPYKDLHYYHLKSNAPIDLAISRSLSQKKDFNEKAFLGV